MRKIWSVAIVWACACAAAFGAGEAATGGAAGSPPAAGKVRIEVGDIPGNHPAAEWFAEQIELFRAANPEIEVQAFGIGGDSRQARPLETLPDLAENVVGVESITGGETAFLVERGLIEPLEKFLPDAEFALEAFDRNLYDAVTYGGKVWGVPWYIEGNFLVYDPAMLKAAGIERPPRTWKELVEDVERLGTDANGDGKPEQWGMRISNKNTLLMIWISMLMQQGASMMDETGIHVEGEAPRAAFEMLQRLAHSPKVRRADAKAGEPCALSIQTSRGIQGLLSEMAEQNLRLAPLPSEGKNINLRSRGIYLCVRKSTPEREAASWKFVKWIVRRDAPPPKVFEGYLCRADLKQRPDFKSLPLADKTNIDAALDAAGYSVDPSPHLGGRLLALSFFCESFNSAIEGKTSYEEGVVQAAKKVNAVTKPHAKVDDALELVR